MLNVQGLGRSGVFQVNLPDGDRGTAQTVAYARQLISEGLRDPDVRRLAVHFCRAYGAPPHDEPAELNALFQGVLDNFQFRKHTVGAQLLQPVRGILETRAGDCADLNQILLPSLLGSIGYPTRAVTIKADPDRPDEFSHVYIEAQLSDGTWVPMDVARVNPAFGKAPEYYWERAEWPLTPGSGQMSGLATRGSGLGNAGGAMPFQMRMRRAFPHRRGMGQDNGGDGFSWGGLLQQTPQILQSVAQVVKASNTPGIPYSAVGYPQIPTTAAGYAPGFSVSAGASSGPLIIGVLVVAGIIGVAIALKR